MVLRDGAPVLLLDPPYLLVQDLLPLAPELPLDESVGETRHIVPDVLDVELRVTLVREIDRRLRRPSCVLGTIGSQQDLRRKYAHLGLLLHSDPSPEYYQ